MLCPGHRNCSIRLSPVFSPLSLTAKIFFMPFNLIDSVRNIFNDDFVSKASVFTGENENSIKAAIAGIIPAVLTGLLHQTGSGDPQNMLSLAREASQSGILTSLSDSLGDGSLLAKGSEMFKSLFGDKSGGVTSLISNFSGIRESSASSLMNVAAPTALGVLGKHAAETNMNAGGMLSFLNNQKESILNAVPSGLNLAAVMGLGSLAGIGGKLSTRLSEIRGARGSSAEKTAHSLPPAKKFNWSPLVIGAIVVLGLVMFLGKGFNGAEKSSSVIATTDTTKPDTAVSKPALVVRETTKVTLPDGTELNAYKGGMEDQLVMFLNNPSGVAGKNAWFDFDNLNFNTDSVRITDESMTQVQNIAIILKSYPKLKIKIGGYTDKTGDSLANLKLSQARADAVLTALKNNGANMKQILGAEGYGSQFAQADAGASDEEKQKDRRISISVRAK
jgi:outer membrane protein OmpA-like peptidoglycan-associated protein